MPTARWETARDELAVTFGRPLDAAERLDELEAEQRAQLHRLQAAIDAGDGVRIHRGRVVLDPVKANPVDADAQRLASELGARLSRLELTELLLEVDAWTQFSTHLTHAAGATPHMAHLTEHLHAALLAAAINLGPTRMAASSDLTYRQLARVRAAAADPLAREFGWRRGGLTTLCWTSDQYSQYGTKVVSVAEREASHTRPASPSTTC